MTEYNNFGIKLNILIYSTEVSQLTKYKSLVADCVLVSQKKFMTNQRKMSLVRNKEHIFIQCKTDWT